MRPARIELIIDELILEGVAPGDRYRVAEQVQRDIETALLSGGPVESNSPGAQVAQAVQAESKGTL